MILHGLVAGLLTTLQFLWDSLFGLIFGFLVSAIVQVALTPATMHRYLGPNLKGILAGAGFGIISSSCSYGSAAAARGFYQKGADVRSIFSFLVASTNMNVAILILFWALLGWKFAFAEFFGGIIIIAVVTLGFTLLFKPQELERLRTERPAPKAARTSEAFVKECPVCGMEGERPYAVEFHGRTYLCCGPKHQADFRNDPARYVGAGDATSTPGTAITATGWRALRHAETWAEIAATAVNDVRMLRTELIVGYLIAGFAAALIPKTWLSEALHAVGAVPVIGYVLLLAVGLAIAVITFVCSMGNVPVARFLASAGIPLGANTSFIYGDLLVPPLVAIYRKSFPERVTWTFVALFAVGAMLAGGIMELAIGSALGGVSMGSMTINDRFTLISNLIGIAAAIAVALAAARARGRTRRPSPHG